MPSLIIYSLLLSVFVSSSLANPWMKTFGMVKNVQDNEFGTNRPRIKPLRPFNGNNRVQKERMTFPANFTTRPPCCADSITAASCKRMQSLDAQNFAIRCLADADFSLVQCCSTCGMAQADERYKHFFALGTESPHCFDRHSSEFCERFKEGTGFWQNTRWTCNGDSTPLAFRVCRKTCGYCNGSIYETPTGKFLPKACGKRAEFLPSSRY
ncbi:hypothetical protein PRIPAC_76081 [Pristionchus pacificus]|uniref:Uncharacterized protein n=1 Tax=Pristionchus pacificus TaxID=54126 RepID=A0A2A6D0I4_PRIPA|nr:hypothetical protein PRIPAC_76081 [Pristionchus pacificus]|eukprot:PDM83801.1 hypothetical protein PRIPAC_30288 [Pristionchus pacificus]